MLKIIFKKLGLSLGSHFAPWSGVIPTQGCLKHETGFIQKVENKKNSAFPAIADDMGGVLLVVFGKS
jgi:hypothetical protein